MAVRFESLGERTDHYSFTARSLQEARQKMAMNGPRDNKGQPHFATCESKAEILHGLTSGIVSGSTMQQPGEGCTATACIKVGTLRYGFIFRFPKWTNIGTLPKPVQTEWNRYLRCLLVHERGHVQVTMPVLKKYLKVFEDLRVVGLGSSVAKAEVAAKEALLRRVQKLYEDLKTETQAESDIYDVVTRHGRTQGAELRTLPPRGGRH
jgi:hypothetical protein